MSHRREVKPARIWTAPQHQADDEPGTDELERLAEEYAREQMAEHQAPQIPGNW